MTHYTISYADLDEPVKTARALQDIRWYLGEKTWAKLGETFIQPGATLNGISNWKECIRYVRFSMAMLGVRGYPARAYLRTVIWLHK